MKILKKSKTILLVLLMLFTSFNYASKIEIKAVARNVTSEFVTGWSYAFGTVWGQGAILKVDGQEALCLEPTKMASVGPNNDISPSDIGMTQAQIDRFALIAWYGYRSNPTVENYFLTNNLIWRELGNPSRVVNATYPTEASMIPWFNEVLNKVNAFHNKPSFDSNTYEVNVNQTLTLEDTNGVLSGLSINSVSGATVTKNGNTLSVTPDISSSDEITISFNRGMSQSQTSTNFVVRSGNSQAVSPCLSGNDPYRAKLKVKVNKFGSLKIAKQNNEGTMIPNTTFKLSYNADMSNEIGFYTTGSDGSVTIDQLLPQTIYMQETSVPSNLVLDSTIRSIKIIPNDTVSYTATNNIQKGKITLKKEDKDTGNKQQGDATLQGAIYGLFAKENIVDPITGSTLIGKGVKIAERTTKADGSMDSIEDLYLGSYYVQELVASNGYEINPEKIDVLLNYAGANETIVIKDITSKEKVIDGDFKITKVIEVDPAHSEITKPEKGAEFVVVLKKYVDRYGSVEEAYKHKDEFADKEYDLLVTDKDGEAISKKLAFGSYLVQQTKAGDENVDKLKKPFEVKIENENQPTIKYVVSNQKFLSYLQLEKKDAETGKTVTLSKTSFKIYDVENDKYLSQRVGLVRHDTWITDDTGKVTLPLKVPAGKYRLEEIKAPAGYLINKDKIDFVMKESNVSIVDDEGEPIQIVEFSNSKPTGSTKLIKSDKDSTESLSGVQYQLTATKDIIDVADGSIIYKEGDPVSMDISENGYYMTNELGEINVEGLPLGSYTWKETKALDGYVQDKKEYTFELKQKDDVQKVYTHEQALTNQKTKVEILKEDTNNNALVCAHLRLIDEDENDVYKWFSDKDAVKLDGLLVGKEYTLYEDKAPEGYVQSKPVKFTVKNTTEVQEIKMIDNQISASKTDVDGKLLSGAKMQVVSAKTKNVVDQWTSSDEAHYINNLVEGHEYILHESEAPQGYVLAKDITFIANDKKEIQTISMIDKQVTALKIDEDGNVLPGAELQVISANTKDIVDEWTSTGKAHDISNLIEGDSYILRELEAPEGLELADDIEFTVDDKKDTQTLEMSDNYILTTIQVNKVDSYTKEAIKSKDFMFTAYKDKNCSDALVTVNANTNDGTATFNLRYGEWWIKEAKAPIGYLLSDEVKHIVINKEGVFVNEKKIDEKDTIYSFIYFNSPLQDDVVKTGDETNIYSFVFLGILSCFAYIFIKLKRKE